METWLYFFYNKILYKINKKQLQFLYKITYLHLVQDDIQCSYKLSNATKHLDN